LVASGGANAKDQNQFLSAELWRVPVAGGTAEKLGLTLDHIIFPTFSPDGRFLAFADRQAPGGLFVHREPAAGDQLAAGVDLLTRPAQAAPFEPARGLTKSRHFFDCATTAQP
jgi:hypothetical protein